MGIRDRIKCFFTGHYYELDKFSICLRCGKQYGGSLENINNDKPAKAIEEPLFKINEILWVRIDWKDRFKHYPFRVISILPGDNDFIYYLWSAKDKDDKGITYVKKESDLKKIVISDTKAI